MASASRCFMGSSEFSRMIRQFGLCRACSIRRRLSKVKELSSHRESGHSNRTKRSALRRSHPLVESHAPAGANANVNVNVNANANANANVAQSRPSGGSIRPPMGEGRGMHKMRTKSRSPGLPGLLDAACGGTFRRGCAGSSSSDHRFVAKFPPPFVAATDDLCRLSRNLSHCYTFAARRGATALPTHSHVR